MNNEYEQIICALGEDDALRFLLEVVLEVKISILAMK